MTSLNARPIHEVEGSEPRFSNRRTAMRSVPEVAGFFAQENRKTSANSKAGLLACPFQIRSSLLQNTEAPAFGCKRGPGGPRNTGELALAGQAGGPPYWTVAGGR